MGRSEGPRSRSGLPSRKSCLYLVAGLADAVLERANDAARTVLRRADLTELVDDGLESLTTRGKIAVDRVSQSVPAHMERLAQRAAARRRSPDADA